ncbi:MAG TPA: type II toxin-antitoxin system VapC family toxin [Rhizomicrobium sp.]
MRAADTNVLLRALVRDDRKQAQIADAFIAEGAWVSHVVLAEAAWVLESTYSRTPHQIATIIDGLMKHAYLTIQEPEIVSHALERFRDHRGVEFADCLILSIAHKSGYLPLGTFDKRLGKLDGAAGL